MSTRHTWEKTPGHQAMNSSSPPRVRGRVSRGSHGIFNWDGFVLGWQEICSPAFRFGECLWHLEVASGRLLGGSLHGALVRDKSMDNLGPDWIEVTFALGWRKEDGAVVEADPRQKTFSRGDRCPLFLLLEEKDMNESLAIWAVTCRFIGGKETEPLPKQIKDSDSLSRGRDGIFNWYLVDIPLPREEIRSPVFRFGECLWHVVMSRMIREYLSAALVRERSVDGLGPDWIEVTFAWGWRKTNGAVVEEKDPHQRTFRKGDRGPPCPLLYAKDLDEFQATKTVTCRFTSWEEKKPRPTQIEGESDALKKELVDAQSTISKLKGDNDTLSKKVYETDSSPGMSTRHTGKNTSGHQAMSIFSTTGALARVSRGSDGVFNWYLVKIPPLVFKWWHDGVPRPGEEVRSPAFRFRKCLWHLVMSRIISGYLSAALMRAKSVDDLGPDKTEVTFSLGWRKADGAVVEEKVPHQRIFRKGDRGPPCPLLYGSSLDEFRYTKTVTCRFTSWEEKKPRSKRIEGFSVGAQSAAQPANTGFSFVAPTQTTASSTSTGPPSFSSGATATTSTSLGFSKGSTDTASSTTEEFPVHNVITVIVVSILMYYIILILIK